ncbi:MAG: cytochrome c3 family protein [Desulfovibrio sp.]|jgi:hypothetical protein|nr:cytochrome c3 family protein [Desulfovibrio sp.]
MRISQKTAFIVLALIVLGGGGFFLYLDRAFPKNRCEGAHLTVPEAYADCLSCHSKVTPKAAQDWQESKHGVLLVKCVVCHGEPDGKGSIPFAVNPEPSKICAACHDPAMKVMTEKFGAPLECNSCHPRHQNSMHSGAFQSKSQSGQSSF